MSVGGCLAGGKWVARETLLGSNDCECHRILSSSFKPIAKRDLYCVGFSSSWHSQNKQRIYTSVGHKAFQVVAFEKDILCSLLLRNADWTVITAMSCQVAFELDEPFANTASSKTSVFK